MKTTLEFNLPEERDQLTLALHGIDWYCALQELDSWLRGRIKHDEPSPAREALAVARSFLLEQLEARNLSFDMVE